VAASSDVQVVNNLILYEIRPGTTALATLQDLKSYVNAKAGSSEGDKQAVLPSRANISLPVLDFFL